MIYRWDIAGPGRSIWRWQTTRSGNGGIHVSLADSCDTPLYSTLATDPELAEIVAMFVAEMPDRIASFSSLFEASKLEDLRRAAHQLKGAAGSYGFEPITHSAARLEDAVRAGQPEEQIRHALEELVALCRSAREGTGA